MEIKILIMKSNNLKWITVALSTLLLLQSCKVYHSKTVTVDEAIVSQKRVLVKNGIDETYKFDRIEIENDILYGITTRNSPTAKKLSKQVIEENLNGKFVKIRLPEKDIKEYRLQNRSLSTILTIAIPITVAGIISVIALYSATRGLQEGFEN